MIFTLTMNPALDKTIYVDEVKVHALNRLHHVLVDAGGKGINVSKTIKELGYESTAYGLLGGYSGAFIRDILSKLQLEAHMIDTLYETRTNIKLIDKNRCLTELNEDGMKIPDQCVEQLRNDLLKEVKEKDIVVISGSVPQGVDKHFYGELVKTLKEKQASVILDADGELLKYGIEAGPDVITPNKQEMCDYLHVDTTISDEELIKRSSKLFDKGINLIVISKGEEGSLFLSKTYGNIKGNALNVEVHSSVGAGDAMTAGIACALEDNMDYEQLIRLSIACSGGAVMSEGTLPARKEVIEDLMKQVTLEKL